MVSRVSVAAAAAVVLLSLSGYRSAGRDDVASPGPRDPRPAVDDASAVLPAELVPAVIDQLQRSGDASYAIRRATADAPAVARNDRHKLVARFDDDRVAVSSDADEAFGHALTLSARALTIDGTTIVLDGDRAPAPADGRVVYAHAPADGVRFDEWFRNGPLGLQHGFDIASLPAGARELQVAVDVGDGWATASTPGDANGAIEMRRADGRGERYAYSYLRAWDASGRFLPAKLTAVDRGLAIAVDVSGAALPITIDPLLQQAILVPGNNTPGSGFGVSVAVRANRALVGAPYTTVGSNANQGVVYYYRRSTTTGAWSLVWTISDPNGQANDWFGYSVAMGDQWTGAIGAPRADPGGVSDGGKVFRTTLFDSSASMVAEVDSPRATDDLFGWSVAMDGNTLVIGAEQDTAPVFGQGTVEVWGYLGGDDTFIRLATLTAPGAATTDHFGYSVAISGDTVVVGAPDVDLTSPARQNVGAAYVYVFTGSTYTFQQRLDRPLTAVACENFGSSVTISGERIVVGSGFSASACSPGGPNVSDIHEFTRSGTTWSWVSSFIPSECISGQTCRGANVSLAASLLTVGLPNEILGGTQSGTVKVYRRTTGGWSAFQRLGAPGLPGNSRVGASVAASSAYALYGVTGAPGQTGFAPLHGPTPGDLSPAVGDGIAGDLGSANGWRQRLNRPFGIGVDGNGRVLIADTYNHRIKEYDPVLDYITFRAGNGTLGSGGDGGAAAAAQLAYPTDVAVDGSGRMYIADSGNHKIRRVQSFTMSTLGGTGTGGFAGDGGPATSAQFNQPYGLGVDSAGNTYVADTNNHRVRRIDAATNIVTTIAGTGTPGYNGDGIAATSAQLNGPRDVAVAPDGSIYIADSGNNRVRRITPGTNLITTVLGTGVYGFNGDGLAGPGTQITFAEKIGFDAAGNLYAPDLYNHRLRRVAGGNGIVTTVAGTGVAGTAGEGGPATAAQLEFPYAVAVAPAGTFIVEEDPTVSRVRKIEPAGFPLNYTRAGTGVGSVSVDPPGTVCGGPSCTLNLAQGTSVTLVAFVGPGSTFAGWSGDCTGTVTTCSVTMSQARNVIASFTGHPQQLTVNVTGTGSGTVTSNVAGINCGPDCTETYVWGTNVTLTATPGANSIFTGWTGDCSGTSTCTVSMWEARSVTAGFAPSALPPTIATRTPSRGSTRGGTVVILTGQNFVAGTTARVGSLGVPVLRRGTTELSFVTPRVDTPGPQTITVQTSGGQATTTFEYANPTYETHTGWRRPSFAVDRYTAFETALPLLPEDTNGVSDIYVHDDVTDTLRRVSISTAGREGIGGESTHAAISATGRFVAFESLASNLVYGDSNGLIDVFLHDRDADEDGVFDELDAIATTRASVSAVGAQATGGASSGASISGNGRFVAFQSSASNLDPADGNGLADVFVYDRLIGRSRRVSIATDGTSATAGTSLRPALSQNGRFVAFDSAAVLTGGDGNGVRDVFVHDRDLDVDGVMDEVGAVATRRISVSTAGAQALGGDSVDASITGDGRYVVYASTAANLVAGDTNAVSDVFLHDRDVDGDGLFDEAGQIATRRSSVGAGGVQFAAASGVPHISANGKLLVFLVASASTPALTTGALTSAVVGSDPGKSTPWGQSDPTNTDGPPPPGKWAPGGPDPGPTDDTDTEDPTTSPDGDQWGGTDVTDEPRVVVHEEPPEPVESPEIATVSPGEGSATGGTLVVIEGSDLAGTLYWNEQPVTPLTTGASRWTLLAPARGGAPATISLYFRDGERRSNSEHFTYITQSVPRWTDHQPRTGPVTGNVPLTITGSGFTAATTVRVGREPATVTAWTATSLTVTLPAAYVAGPVAILVTNADGAEAPSNVPFTYQNVAEPVTLLRLEPQGASIVGGTAVTILGSGFAEGTSVTFGGRAVTGLQRLSSRTLVAEAPAASPGTSEVQVRVPGQTPVSMTFEYAATPVVVVACAGADADADGMDDAWEVQYGLAAGDPSDGADDPDHDGLTSTQECQGASHPRGFYSRYLAEGATGQFFDTRIAIANPNASAARVLLKFQTGTGVNASRFLLVPPMSRRSVRPAQLPELASADVSTVVESDVEVVVDRTMLWGGGPATGLYGSHAESSLPSARTEWYLAEGATHGNFDLFYLLQNPGPLDAIVRIRYLRKAPLTPVERDYTVAARRRVTIQVDAIPGLEAADVSAVFRSLNDVPIIVERAMYATPAGARGFESGHDSAAIAAPATRWFLAEGATGVFFNTYLLLANPNPTAAAVTITYLLPGGRTVVRTHPVAGNSRETIHIADEAPELAAGEMSSIVTSDVPIVVERSMWWPGTLAFTGNPAFRLFWGEAHNAPGATATGTKWAVGDGETGPEPVATQTFYLIANTSAYAADVQVTLLSETDQAPMTRRFTVAANSRFTVSVAADFPATTQDGNRTFGAVIESLPVGGQAPAQIVVERAMYSNANELFWAAGSDVLATRLR